MRHLMYWIAICIVIFFCIKSIDIQGLAFVIALYLSCIYEELEKIKNELRSSKRRENP